MPSKLPTLARVLAALDAGAIHDEGAAQRRCADAARLLRALAADFARFAPAAEAHFEEYGGITSEEALRAAVARWRLDEEGKRHA